MYRQCRGADRVSYEMRLGLWRKLPYEGVCLHNGG